MIRAQRLPQSTSAQTLVPLITISLLFGWTIALDLNVEKQLSEMTGTNSLRK